MRCVRIILMTFAGCGVLFCLLSLLSLERIILACLAVAAASAFMAIPALKRRLAPFADLTASQMRVFLVIVVLVSILERVLMVGYFGGDSLAKLNTGDASFFWRYARAMADGDFPDVKSWTTVAAYAFCVRVFGRTLLIPICLNFFLSLVTARLVFRFGEVAFGRRTGVCAAALYLLSPSVVLLSLRTASENFYFVFLAAVLYFCARWFECQRLGWLGLSAVAVWLAVWSRGEGILLVPAVLLFVALTFCVDASRRRSAILAAGVFLAVVMGGAAVGLTINHFAHGTHTVFCSNDNYWPRLIGANVQTDGHIPTGKQLRNLRRRGMLDKQIIKRRYLADHPGDPDGVIRNMRPQTCPSALIPYIEREINRRWAKMTLGGMVRFVLIKEWLPWCNSYVGHGRLNEKTSPCLQLLFGLTNVFVLLAGCRWFCWMIASLWGKRELSVCVTLQFLPFVCICGMICLLALAESNLRYGVCICVLLPFYAAGGAFAQPSRE